MVRGKARSRTSQDASPSMGQPGLSPPSVAEGCCSTEAAKTLFLPIAFVTTWPSPDEQAQWPQRCREHEFSEAELAVARICGDFLDEGRNKPTSLTNKPAIAQLVEHLTVDSRSNQMVPGSIPGGRIYCQQIASCVKKQ